MQFQRESLVPQSKTVSQSWAQMPTSPMSFVLEDRRQAPTGGPASSGDVRKLHDSRFPSRQSAVHTPADEDASAEMSNG